MQLCYLWVDRYKCFDRQGINLHPRYRFHWDGQGLSYHEQQNYLPLFTGRPLAEITGLIGRNGSGKSSAFKLIMLLLDAVSMTPGERETKPQKIDALRSAGLHLFVFACSDGPEPVTTGPLAGVGDVLRTFAFQAGQQRFLVVLNRADPPPLKGPDGLAQLLNNHGSGWVDFNARLAGIYYNHTLETAASRLLRHKGIHQFAFGHDRSNLTMLPGRENGALFAKGVENELAQALIALYAGTDNTTARCRQFRTNIWQPQWATLSLKNPMFDPNLGGDLQFKQGVFGEVIRDVSGLSPDSITKFVSFFDRSDTIRTIRAANAWGMLATLLNHRWDPNNVNFFGVRGIDLKTLVEGGGNKLELILAPIKERAREIAQDLDMAGPAELRRWTGTVALKEQLRRGLYFEEHHRDIPALKKPDSDDTSLHFELEEATPAERAFLLNLPEWFGLDLSDAQHGGRRLATLSGGERHMLYLLANINHVLLHLRKSRPGAQVLLLMDEADLGLHPEWQRQTLSLLHEGLGHDDQTCQMIYATHSPFIASDLPHTHLTLMKRQKDGQCQQVTGRKHKTFGANIHELLNDTFFLENTIGAFARITLQRVFAFCSQVHERYQQVTDPDFGAHDEAERQAAERKLLADLVAYRFAAATDERSRARLQKMRAVIGESVLGGMLTNNIALLDRLCNEFKKELKELKP